MNLGTDRAKTAFAESWNAASLLWVIGVGKRGVAETFWFSAVHDLPDIIRHEPFNLLPMDSKKRIPVFLNDLFEGEAAFFGDRFHNGLEC